MEASDREESVAFRRSVKLCCTGRGPREHKRSRGMGSCASQGAKYHIYPLNGRKAFLSAMYSGVPANRAHRVPAVLFLVLFLLTLGLEPDVSGRQNSWLFPRGVHPGSAA